MFIGGVVIGPVVGIKVRSGVDTVVGAVDRGGCVVHPEERINKPTRPIMRSNTEGFISSSF